MDESKVVDLTLYPTLDESVILRILQARFASGSIYTYIKNILLSVNPFSDVALYDYKTMQAYRTNFAKASPHVFAIAQAAFSELISSGKNQSILISGESGAGKTETFKYIVGFLARAQRRSRLVGQYSIEEQIIQINPILEAFGNAQTKLNSNSSRFGKFTELWFDDVGAICGAKFVDYLLEKSRITKQSPGERNYHIFYYLFAGLSKEQLGAYKFLSGPKDYEYLGRTDSAQPTDFQGYQQLRLALEQVGFDSLTLDRIFGLLSAVLRLGNISFCASTSEVAGMDAIDLENPKELEVVTSLLGLSYQTLVQGMTFRTVSSMNRQSSFATPLTQEQAKNIRDTMARMLYEKLFKYILGRLNVVANNGHIYPVGGYIGLLDIYGFEVFDKNDFEQFCINFANEKLQSFFSDYIFKFEQADYLEEGIKWSKIDFLDNSECLNLFTQKPLGLISLLEEESTFPGATAITLVSKFDATHGSPKSPNSSYFPVKTSPTQFGVNHFAAKVSYHADDFIEKNKNSLNNDVLVIFGSCENPLVQELFASEFPDYRLSGNMERPGGSTRAAKAVSRKKKLWALNTGTNAPKTKGTTMTQFKQSLEELIRALVDTNPYFVRCIKSNAKQTPLQFETEYVRTQLKYLGVAETVRIRKLGYSVRLRFEEFSFRYQKLKPRNTMATDSQQECLMILSSCMLEQKSFQMGKTKVFLREAGAVYLEKCVKCLQAWAAHQIATQYREYRRALKAKEAERLRIEQEKERLRLKAIEEERLRLQKIEEDKERERLAVLEAEKERLRRQKEEEEAVAAAAAAAKRQEDAAIREKEREETIVREEAAKEAERLRKEKSLADAAAAAQRLPPLTPLSISSASAALSPGEDTPKSATSDVLSDYFVGDKSPVGRESPDVDEDHRSDSNASDKRRGRKTKEETKKMFEELIKTHAEISTSKSSRGETAQKFSMLIKSEQKKLSPLDTTRSLVLPPLPVQKDTRGMSVAQPKTKAEEPASESKSSIMGKLFKGTSRDDMAKSDDGKKKDKSFDALLKSDSTVKMTLKDGSATRKETSGEKFESYLKRAEKEDPKATQAAPSNKDNTPVMERLREVVNENESDAKKTRRRSRTISDMRSISARQDNSSKEAKILIWMEQVLEESLLAPTLIQAIRNGDLLCSFICKLHPQNNPYLGKGETFSIQKITFFLQCCRQLGLRDRDLFSVVDLESGNLQNVVGTFTALSNQLKSTSYQGVLLEGVQPEKLQTHEEELVDLAAEETENAPEALASVNELLETERAYIHSVKIVISYLDTIRRKQLLQRNDVARLFSNIEEILSVHEILMKELNGGRANIGAVFLKMIHYLKVYSVYCANYPTAVHFLNSRKEHDHLRTFLNTFLSLEESGGLAIETFLMKPVQRICKYPLLLRQINTLTPATHPTKAILLRAIEKIEEVVDSVNDRRRQVESSEKIMQLEQKFLGGEKLNLLTPTRKFIHEGEVFKVFAAGKLREREIFLFNDLFILATPQGTKREKFVVKTVVPLDQVELVSNPGSAPDIPDDDPKRKIGVEKFNESHKKGVEYLIQEEIIDKTPESIASFLRQTPELSRAAVGECIGAPANKAVLKAYCDQLDVSGMRYDEALRSFLSNFRLPGEAQIIDRIVQSFSERFCEQNPGIFPNVDLAYTLVFAMIMLNTSLHNPRVDRKMTQEDFIYNFRNADEAAAIPDKMLEAMYKSIKDEKLEMGVDEQEQSGRIAIMVKNFPTKLVYGEKSPPITVSINMPDSNLKLKLQGQGIECEPNILTFETSAKQTFTIKGFTLGRSTLAFAKMGKSARLYSKPHPGSILIRLPALEYNFELQVTTGIGAKKSQESLLLGVKSLEDQKVWISLFEAALGARKDRSRIRSDSSPALLSTSFD